MMIKFVINCIAVLIVNKMSMCFIIIFFIYITIIYYCKYKTLNVFLICKIGGIKRWLTALEYFCGILWTTGISADFAGT